MKEVAKPRPPRVDEEVPEQVQGRGAATEVEVARSPVRCPYCHDSCTADDVATIVCQSCLSRHHGACWREGGSCATCSSTRALRPDRPEVRVAPAEVKLLRGGLHRAAVERLTARLGVSEDEARAALLEAAVVELQTSGRKLPPWAVVAITALIIPILGILFG